MRNIVVFTLLALTAVQAYGHAGEVHKYMGTVETVHDDGSFMLKTTDGATMHVFVSDATVYQKADGKAATRAALVAGIRAVVTIGTDGKTATVIRFGAKKN